MVSAWVLVFIPLAFIAGVAVGLCGPREGNDTAS